MARSRRSLSTYSGTRRTRQHSGPHSVQSSPTGLGAFLDGREPYSSTRRKLNAWYLRSMAQGTRRLTPETANTVLALIVADLPPARRSAALREVVEILTRHMNESGAVAPTWLEEAWQSLGAATPIFE